MASDQHERRDTTEREVHIVERERVPKMASHFESLAHNQEQQTTTVQQGVGKEQEMNHSYKLELGGAERRGHESEATDQQLSLEEISRLRQSAQQTANDAQHRYNKGKDTLAQDKDTVGVHAKDTAQQAKDTIVEKGPQAKDTVLEGAQKTSQYISDRGGDAKDATMEKGEQGYMGTLARVKDYTVEKGAQAKDTVLEKGQQAKDKVLEGAQKTTKYITDKGGNAKDATVEKGEQGYSATKETLGRAKDYTLNKAAAAKDVTKVAAEYAGKVAGDVKVAKMVEGSKTAVEYVSEKVVSKPVGESAKKYTGRKKEEAERVSGSEELERRHEDDEGRVEIKEQQQKEEGGVVEAIGETVAEIAQSTKQLMIGKEEEEEKD